MSCTILSQYPFSNEFRGKLETCLGEAPVYVSVSELRGLPAKDIWRRLRRIDAQRILIPVEDEGARTTLPFLKLLAGVTRAGEINVVNADLRATRTTRWGLARDLFSVGTASIKGRLAATSAEREIRSLLRSSRVEARIAESKKVLYINANLWFGVKAGGSVGHIAGVVNALSQLGFEINYASASGNAMIDPGVKTFQLAPPKSFGFPLEYNHYRFNDSATQQILSAFPGGHRFVYQRMSLANFTGVRYSRQQRIPLVLEYNGSEAWIAKNWGRPLKNHDLAVAAEDVCLKHAHVVVTISEALKNELMQRGVDEMRIALYPNCVDERLFDPIGYDQAAVAAIRDQHGIPRDAVVIGFVGTFGPWHGVEVLASAIAKLANDDADWLRRSRVRFLLVGDGQKMGQVRQIVEGANAMDFVTLTGLVPQHRAPAYLAACDILASPHVPNPDGTPFFGSPTKLFEYMAMGKAIIASDLDQIGEVLKNSMRVGSLPHHEVLRGDHLAVLCKPATAADIVEAIHFLVSRPQTRALLGDNARAECVARYTWKRHTTHFLQTMHATAV